MKEQNNRSAHILHNVVLAQWNQFELEMLILNVAATLLSGENGAGKTTIFDAIQFVLMGGDQRKTRYNSAFDAKSSGRSARSYALGEFIENDVKSCQRESANTYIFLNWYDNNQRPYSFGLSIYANSQLPNIDTRGHIIKGRHITKADLLSRDNAFLPWREFVECMKLNTKDSNGAVSYELIDNARTIREKIAEAMSLNQTRGAKIEPDLLVKTLSNALKLKMDSPIDPFIRDFILPQDSIETHQMREDLLEHQRIEEEIARAESHKSARESLILEAKKLTQYRTNAHHAVWVSQQAETVRLNEELGRKEDAKIVAQECQSTAKRTIDREELRLPELKQIRDDALVAWQNSDAANLNRAIDVAKNTVSQSKNNLTNAIYSLQKALREVIHQRFYDTFGIQSFELLAKHWVTNAGILDSAGADSLCASELERTLKVTDKLKSAKAMLDEMAERIEAADKDVSLNSMQTSDKFKVMNARIERLRKGLSDINSATGMAIELLKRAGIESMPVCDLCEIPNKDWQEAVESYLGSNREALVVSVRDFDHAIEVYESAQKVDPRLKRVRIINPDHALAANKVPTEKMVSTLIETSNPIARGFMNIVLDRTKMAATRDELRKERKALTVSGLTTGGGTVGSTAQIQGLLMGKQTKAEQLTRLEHELEVLTQRVPVIEKSAKMLSTLNRNWAVISASIVKNSASVKENSNLLIHDQKTLAAAMGRLKPLTSNDEQLKAANEHTEGIYIACYEAITNATFEQKQANETLSSLNIQIESLLRNRNEAERIRSETEKSPIHNAAKATERWQNYEQKFEGDKEIYSLISNKALNDAGDAREDAVKTHRDLHYKVVKFTTDFAEDIANRQDLLEAAKPDNVNTEAYYFIETDSMAWVERVLTVELLHHRQEAQEAAEKMEKNFRGIIVGELRNRFEQMKYTFNQLNNLLKKVPFHNHIYSFHSKVREIESLSTVYEYITTADREETELVGTLFETVSEHPAIRLLKEALISGDDLINEISDYRSFFTYDMKMHNPDSGIERSVADMQSTGSGGEQQTPAYIALAASFMNVYKICGNSAQGASLVLLDEAFNNMDGGNASAAVAFLKKIGLQLLIAAPPEVTLKIGKEMNQIYTICREGRDVVIDHTQIFEEGQELIDQRNPVYHPKLVAERAAELKAKSEAIE